MAGIEYFPDAPTERGVRHIHELVKAQQEGFRCFVIQMLKVGEVRPNIETHLAFGEALEEAMLGVVKIILPTRSVKPYL